MSDPARTPHEMAASLPDDLEPTIDLEARQRKRQQLDTLFARAMSGLLPRMRALHSWEPDMLDERHLHAILLRSGGMSQGQIAKFLGWTESWTSVVLNHPDSQYVLTRLISYAADNVIDLEARIKAHAPEALDTVLETMRTSADESLKSRNAFELLKLAGYGTSKAATGLPGSTNTFNTQINLGNAVPEKAIGLLASAIREAREIEEVTYVLPAPAELAVLSVAESGGGDAPAPLGPSGDQGAGDLPPASGSQSTELQEKVA